jgi:hypothetical protein
METSVKNKAQVVELEAAQREILRLQKEIDELRQTVKQQERYLDTLEIMADKIEYLLEQENRLKAILLNTNSQLLHRMDALHTLLTGTPQAEQLPRQLVQTPYLSPGASQHSPANNGLNEDQQVWYQQLIQQIRAIAEKILPLNSIVVVVSKGDGELLKLGIRQGLHFPQTKNGTYAGHHPVDSAAAISQLESLRVGGSHYFMLPSTAYWWLDHYREFHAHLNTHYQQIWNDEYCIIYHLSS